MLFLLDEKSSSDLPSLTSRWHCYPRGQKCDQQETSKYYPHRHTFQPALSPPTFATDDHIIWGCCYDNKILYLLSVFSISAPVTVFQNTSVTFFSFIHSYFKALVYVCWSKQEQILHAPSVTNLHLSQEAHSSRGSRRRRKGKGEDSETITQGSLKCQIHLRKCWVVIKPV